MHAHGQQRGSQYGTVARKKRRGNGCGRGYWSGHGSRIDRTRRERSRVGRPIGKARGLYYMLISYN